ILMLRISSYSAFPYTWLFRSVVVTTALVRGRARRTVTAEAVAGMLPGSVVVDLAASGGGNCALTVPGDRVVTENGVVILGWTDLDRKSTRLNSSHVKSSYTVF